MKTIEWQNKVLIASKGKHIPGTCQISGEKFTTQNTSDGVHGYELAVLHPDIPTKTIRIEVCKKVYLEFYKEKYPDAETPKI